MAKIGIYIPEDRMKDIEAYRDYINYSQLFMEAFDAAVKTRKKRSAEASAEQERMLKARVDRVEAQIRRAVDDAVAIRKKHGL